MNGHVIIAPKIQEANAEMRRLGLEPRKTVCLSTDDGNARLRIMSMLIDPEKLHHVGRWQKGRYANELAYFVNARVMRFEANRDTAAPRP